MQIPLAAVADIRVVEGPSMIKSENGLLRSYIQLRVQNRDEVGFVEEAQQVVADKVLKSLPPGMYLEWTGTFEHQVRANKTLRVIFPAVIALIALILYLTHKSWIDALLMMTSVLGALVRRMATTQAVIDSFVVIGGLTSLVLLLLAMHRPAPEGPASPMPARPLRPEAAT